MEHAQQHLLNYIIDNSHLIGMQSDFRRCIIMHRINGEFIGGCNDGPPEFGGINTLNSINKLDGMLIAAGAM